MSFKTREYTNKILELVDDGIVDKDWLIQGLLMWLSESDVAEFYDRNLRPDEEEEEYIYQRHPLILQRLSPIFLPQPERRLRNP